MDATETAGGKSQRPFSPAAEIVARPEEIEGAKSRFCVPRGKRGRRDPKSTAERKKFLPTLPDLRLIGARTSRRATWTRSSAEAARVTSAWKVDKAEGTNDKAERSFVRAESSNLPSALSFVPVSRPNEPSALSFGRAEGSKLRDEGRDDPSALSNDNDTGTNDKAERSNDEAEGTNDNAERRNEPAEGTNENDEVTNDKAEVRSRHVQRIEINASRHQRTAERSLP